MAVARNLIGEAKGTGRADPTEPRPLIGARAVPGARTIPAPTLPAPGPAAPPRGLAAPPRGVAIPPRGFAIPPQPENPIATPAVSPTAAGPLVAQFADLGPQILTVPGLFLASQSKSTTQIAQGAIKQLLAATPAVVQEAVRTITNKRVAANQLLNYLERKTRIGEVLSDLAKDWDEPTPQDFAEAFQMPAGAEKFPVMDTIVSIAILNDPDLRDELEAENTTEPSTADLMENRRIVWQWPEPGTPFTPPYVMMVAVERQDTRQAESVIQSILGDLVDFQGFKLPRETVKKL